jgi:hypothetical protein
LSVSLEHALYLNRTEKECQELFSFLSNQILAILFSAPLALLPPRGISAGA